MNNRYEDVNEIDLVELLWDILRQWRKLIIAGLVCAILFGAYSYVSSYMTYRKYEKNVAEQEEALAESTKYANRVTRDDIAELTDKMTKAELLEIDQAVDVYESRKETEEYLEDSILMNSDAYNMNRMVITYDIDSMYTFNYTEDNESDYTSRVINAYATSIGNGALSNYLVNEGILDYKPKYIDEVISVYGSGGNTFTFSATCFDDDTMRLIADAVDVFLRNQTPEINKSIGAHNLNKYSEKHEVIRNEAIAQTKANLVSKIVEETKSIEQYKKEFKKNEVNQIAVYNYYSGEAKLYWDEDEIASVDMEKIVRPEKASISKKQLVLGILVGWILVILALVYKVVLLGTLQTENDVERFGIKYLGRRTYQASVTTTPNKIDKWINKMQYGRKVLINDDECLEYAIANIELECKKQGISKIYVTGSELEGTSDYIVSLVTELDKVGISVVKGGLIGYDAVALTEMNKTGNVVLVERLKHSRMTEVMKENRIIEENNGRLIGAILV